MSPLTENVAYYMNNGEKLAQEVKHVPLLAKAYTYSVDQFDAMKRGTKFGGENKLGLNIEDRTKLEAKLRTSSKST